MRRWVEAPAGTLPAPTADMVDSCVEDWVDAEEIDAHTFATDCPVCNARYQTEADCAFKLAWRAHRRRQAFRRDWMAEQGVDDRDSWRLWPEGRVSWRDSVPALTQSRLAAHQLRNRRST